MYSDLVIFEDFDRFAGTVAITNPFGRDIEVLVNVDLYDGDQAVGEISGMVTLKPESTSVVELDGFDDFGDFTESRVHLSGWPVSAPQERTPRHRRRGRTDLMHRLDWRTRRRPQNGDVVDAQQPVDAMRKIRCRHCQIEISQCR